MARGMRKVDVTPRRPVPVPEELTRPYWDGAAAQRLVLQQCQDCRRFQHPPTAVCMNCQSADLGWAEARQTGRIRSMTILQQDRVVGFEDVLPLAVVVVESDEQEGLYLLGNLPRDEGTIARIGDRVTMFFEPVTDELRLPQWMLAGDS